jgi:hypothetical protein
LIRYNQNLFYIGKRVEADREKKSSPIHDISSIAHYIFTDIS